MEYCFRVDASKASGAGHFFRLLPLMELLCSRNEQVTLIGDLNGLPFIEALLSRIPISGPLSHANSWKPKDDCTLIIDSYDVPLDDEIFTEHRWTRVVVLGDASTPKYRCDIFIGAGPISREFRYELNSRSDMKVAAGPEYFSLRQDLSAIKGQVKIETSVPDILVIGGGGDVNGYTEWVTRALASSKLEFRATVITDEPLDSMLELDTRFNLHRPTHDLAEFYRSATMVFSAAGTTALECVALNIPVAVAQTSSNQQDQYFYLTEEADAFPLGGFEAYLIRRQEDCPVDKAIEWCLLARKSSRGPSRIALDGQGAERIYAQFLAPGNASD